MPLPIQIHCRRWKACQINHGYRYFQNPMTCHPNTSLEDASKYNDMEVDEIIVDSVGLANQKDKVDYHKKDATKIHWPNFKAYASRRLGKFRCDQILFIRTPIPSIIVRSKTDFQLQPPDFPVTSQATAKMFIDSEAFYDVLIFLLLGMALQIRNQTSKANEGILQDVVQRSIQRKRPLVKKEFLSEYSTEIRCLQN